MQNYITNYKIFQQHLLNNRRFLVFPGAISNSKTFAGVVVFHNSQMTHQQDLVTLRLGGHDTQRIHACTHTHPFNGPFSRTTRVSRYQKGKTSLDFTEARDSEWQWHQLGHMQVCTSLQTDNHASTPPLSFLQAGCPSCRPTNSIKALRT